MRRKIRKAKTDQFPIPETTEELKNRHEAINLINIYASFAGEKVEDVLRSFSGNGFASFKNSLSELIKTASIKSKSQKI